MQKLMSITYKVFLKGISVTRLCVDWLCTWIVLYFNNVKFANLKSKGIPYIMVSRGGICVIGENFHVNNGLQGNSIGRPQRCILFVGRGAKINIGTNVGISSTAIVSHMSITIDDFVKIGGGCCIYDTDFHSLDTNHRKTSDADMSNKECAPVHIKEGAFIGAHTTILKGVTIGENSIIRACSVVTKDILPNQIWAGNSARFIRNIEMKQK